MAEPPFSLLLSLYDQDKKNEEFILKILYPLLGGGGALFLGFLEKVIIIILHAEKNMKAENKVGFKVRGRRPSC
jgi:hypothetical protein